MMDLGYYRVHAGLRHDGVQVFYWNRVDGNGVLDGTPPNGWVLLGIVRGEASCFTFRMAREIVLAFPLITRFNALCCTSGGSSNT